MEIPPDIRLDPAQLSAGAEEVDDRAARMRARRDEIGSAVECLLETWHGEAAARFAGLWRQWADGADEVIAALAVSATAMRHARDQLVAADDDRTEAHTRLRDRLTMSGPLAVSGHPATQRSAG